MFFTKRSILLGTLCLSAYTLPSLFATTSVTTSSPIGPGSLSEAIIEVNTGASTSPIQIADTIETIATTSAFPPVTTSVTIGSLRALTTILSNDNSRTLSFVSGSSAIGSSIGLFRAPILVTGGSTVLDIGAAPIVRSPIVAANGATVILSGNNRTSNQVLSAKQSSAFVLSGEVGPDSAATLSTGSILATVSNAVSVKVDTECTLIANAGVTLTIPVLTQKNASEVFIEGSGIVSVEHIITTSTADMSIHGSIGGVNDLLIEGPGVVNFTGVSSYLGNTNIGRNATDKPSVILAAGAALGTTASDIVVNKSASLKTDGTLYARNITNNGVFQGEGEVICLNLYNQAGSTIASGMSPARLSIIGDVFCLPQSNTFISITPDSTSSLDILGSFNILDRAVLQLVPNPGCYVGPLVLEVISAGGGLEGAFSQVIMSSPLLTADLIYTPTSLSLNINRARMDTLPLDGNNIALARNLEKQISGGDVLLCSEIGKLIGLSLAEINAILDQLQPALLKGLTVSQENNAVKIQDTLNYRNQVVLDSKHCHLVHSKTQKQPLIGCDQDARPYEVWAAGFGDAMHQSSTHFASSSQIGYQDNMGGAAVGIDYSFLDMFYMGALGAYTHSNVTWTEDRGKGSINTGYAGLYLSAIGDLFYGNASIIGGWSHYSAHRNIAWTDASYTAKNSHGGAQILSHIDTGINLGWDGFTLRPFDSFDYISQTENSYTETGSSRYNLHIDKNNSIMLRNELGLNFAFCFCKRGNKWILSPKISWVREVRIKGKEITANFQDTNSFEVVGYFPSRSLVSPGLSLTGVVWEERLVVGLYYNGQYDGNYSDHSFGGEVRFGF